MEKLIIQVRKYPYVAGNESQSVVIEDSSLERAFARIELLYEALDRDGEAKILFRR